MKERSLYPDVASSHFRELPLYQLGLGWPVYNCLQQAGIETVGQLAELSVKEISRIPGLTLEAHFHISDRFFSPLCEKLIGSEASLSRLSLPATVHDALIKAGVSTLGALSSMSYVDVLALPGIEMRHVAKIRNRLKKLAGARSASAGANDLRLSSVAPREGGNDVLVDAEDHPAADESAESADKDALPCCPGLVGDNTPIAVLELSQLSHYALLKAGITTIGQLAATSIQELQRLRLVDAALSDQIREKLEDFERHRPPEAEDPWGLDDQPLSDLDLSTPAHNALKREGISTLDQLLKLSSAQILNIRGIDQELLGEIRRKLETIWAKKLPVEETSAAADQPDQRTSDSTAATKDRDRESRAFDPLHSPPLEVLDLSARAYNCLRRVGCYSVGQIASVTDEQLLMIPRVGAVTLREIKTKLRDYLNSCGEPAEDFRPTLHRQPIEILGLSQNTRAILAEEGFASVGWLVYSLQSGGLDVRQIGGEAMSEIESALDEYFSGLASSASDGSPPLERGLESSLLPSEADLSPSRSVISQDTPIEALELSTRIRNALSRGHIGTIGELMKRVESGDLMKVRNIGQKSVADIKEALSRVQIVPQESEEPEEPADVAQKVVEVPVIPSDVIGWQANLVERQISAGLLHRRVQVSQQSISNLLSAVEDVDPREAYDAMAGIIGGSLNLCEELEFLLDQTDRDDCITILLSRYGYETQTLEEVGSRIGVTRERVRQLGNRLEREIGTLAKLELRKQLGEATGMPSFIRMQSALLMAEDMGLEITYDSWKRRIVNSGLVGSWTSSRYSELDPIESMIAVCNLVADRKISELTIPPNLEYAIKLAASGSPTTRAKVARIRKNLSPETVKTVNRHARFSGAVHVEWLAREIGRSRPQTAEILRALGYRLISGSWFGADPRDDEDEITGHDVFHHAMREMFQYCGPLSADDVCSGLRHYLCRTRFPVPPPGVMEEVLSMYGYQLEDGLWYCEEETDEQLSRGERIIKQCIDQHGPVVHHSQLTEAFIESELSFPSLHATLRRSPIFERIDKGLYKLRGTSVSHDDIRRAESAAERVSVEPSVEYSKSGSVILSANLSAHSLATGVITSQRFPNLSGDWDCFAGAKHFGKIEATDNQVRYLGEPLEHLGCQPEDRVRLIFNVWDRTVEIEKVQN